MFRKYLTSLISCMVILGITLATITKQAVSAFSSNKQSETSSVVEETDVEKGHEIEKEVTTGEVEEENGLMGMINGFTSNLAGKEAGAKYASKISQVTSGNTYIESTEVLLGKDNWLFYKSTSDGDPISDYQGINHYDEATLSATAQKLVNERNIIESYGTKFVLMSIPNKENVYSEYMPDTIVQEDSTSKTDLLMEYLKANTDLTVVDAKPALLATKEAYQVYYKTDTHFNEIGSFIAVQAFKEVVDANYDSLKTVKFNVTSENYAGDLAQLCNMADTFNDDVVYALDTNSVNTSLRSDEKILIVGDSFGDHMVDVMSNYYAEVNTVNIWSFSMDLIAQYQPDIVVWECAERYTDRYNWISITG